MKHSRLSLILFTALAFICLPQQAHAQLTLETCAPGHQSWEYTSIVVDCVQTAIIGATNTMMGGLSNYMGPIVGAAMVLVIAIFGIRIASGEPQLIPKAVGFLLRLAIVLMFSYNLGGFSSAFFGIEAQLTALASGGYSPWLQIDTFLGQLFGFGEGLQLYQGMLGLVAASLFTSVPGMMLFGAAVMGLIKLLMFVFDIVYVYLAALIIMGFMLVLSPLVVPLALFQQTERYVKKWLDILMMSMITPVLLFGFLFMFLSIFSLLVGNIFDTLGGDNFQGFYQLNQQKFSWMVPVESNKHAEDEDIASMNGQPQEVPAVPGNITPQLTQAFDLGSMFTTPGVNFGSNSTSIMQQLGFDFVTLAIFAAIMQTMIHGIPQVASSIAGVLTQVPMQFTTSPKARLQEAAGNIKFGAMVGGGAMAGGLIAAGLTGKNKNNQPLARQVGGVIGGIGGAFLGRM